MENSKNKLKADTKTADAFANSWNNLPSGSIYTYSQFVDWFEPLTKNDIQNKTVLELGCGNGSLMTHMTGWNPAKIEGVDLGDSIKAANTNLAKLNYKNWKITQSDLTEFNSDGFDLVYSIGVLHHLKNPKKGFDAVIRNTNPGGSFHCWVYAREGNNVIVFLVDPIRKISSKFPWWVTKYLIATPLVFPYFLYAKLVSKFPSSNITKKLPLYKYSLWIAKRSFSFFRHVAFDQLVTPQTAYIPKNTIELWMKDCPNVEQESTYAIFRNGNSWKFGGKLKE